MTHFQHAKRYRLFMGQMEEHEDGPYMLVSEHLIMVDHLRQAIRTEQERTERVIARADYRAKAQRHMLERVRDGKTLAEQALEVFIPDDSDSDRASKQ